MAKKVIKAAYLALGGTDYSAQIKGVELSIDAPEVDVTNMASGGWNESLQGIKSGSLKVDFVKDGDLTGLDSALWTALTGASGTLTFEVRIDSAAVSATNPKYTGTLSITQHMVVTISSVEALPNLGSGFLFILYFLLLFLIIRPFDLLR